MRNHAMLAGVGVVAILLAAPPASADVKAGYDAWQRGDYATAVGEWRGDALKGDATAQFNLGQAYKLGRGVAMDDEQAVAWFKRAADQGHIEAFDNLGILLFNMNRRSEALPYILKSAERGEARAQYILGTASFNGDLVAKNWPRAYALIQLASTKGLAIASTRLAELDKYIPLDQRQKGLAMAVQMERDEARTARMVPPAGPVVAVGSAQPVRVAAAPRPAPARIATPAAGPVTAGGPWTAQLGAFSSQHNAASLWAQLAGRAPFSGYSAHYAKAGALVRLQAGAFPTREAAASFCRAATAAGQSCFPAKR